MYLLLERHIPPLTPFFSTINNILSVNVLSVKRSNFTFVFVEAAYYAKPEAVRKQTRSSLYILRQTF